MYRVESEDNFATARMTGVFETGKVNPTTVAMRGSDLYVLYAMLNQNRSVPAEFPIQRVTFTSMP